MGPPSAARTLSFDPLRHPRPSLLDAHRTPASGRPAAGSHRIDYHLFLFPARGRLQGHVDGRAFHADASSLFWARPGQIVRIDFRDCGLHDTLCFVRDACAIGIEAPRPEADLVGRFARREELERIRQNLRALEEELRSPAASPQVLHFALAETVARLRRASTEPGAAAPAPDRAPWASRFSALVEERFTQTRRVEDYAAWLHLSASRLKARCREAFGCSPKRWIDRRVSDEAKRRLLARSATATEIGYRLGFEDPAYFFRFFRRQVGESPDRFRRRHADRSVAGLEPGPGARLRLD